MAQDFEQLLQEVFGEPLSRLTRFQSDQIARLTAKMQEIAREAVREELNQMHADLADLRTRVARLEAERVEAAADQV